MKKHKSLYELYLTNGLDEPLVFRRSIWVYLFALITSFLFVVISVLMLFDLTIGFVEKLIALVGIVFFGFGFFISIHFLKSSSTIILDKEGLFSARYQVKIPWHEIKVVKLAEVEVMFIRMKWLGIQVYDSEKLYKKMSWVGQFTRVLNRNNNVHILVLLLQLTDILGLPDAALSIREAKEFHFHWPFAEFPKANMQDVKRIIEMESQRV